MPFTSNENFTQRPFYAISKYMSVYMRVCMIFLSHDIQIHNLCSKYLTKRFHLFKDLVPDNWPLEYVLSGGQPVTAGSLKCLGKLCNKFICCYGATEFVFLSYGIFGDQKEFVEFSCGEIVKGPTADFKIVDADEKVLPIGERGEIYVKALSMFSSYYNDPEKTKAVFTDDGWFKTDDFGRMTSDGHIFVDGRKSNLIISGGMNIAPELLERVLKMCPGVDAVALVPVSHPVYYQEICACVIRQTGSQLSEEDVRKFCTDYHNDKPGVFTVLPKYYMFLDDFPLTNTGKISRQALKHMAEERFAVGK